MRKILIIKTGCAFPAVRAKRGDFEHWILEGMAMGPENAIVVDVGRGETLPEPARMTGAVITGSHAMVTERSPWSENTAEWLFRAVGGALPLLGICYGHQLLAHALGGEVGPAVAGRESGTVEIRLTPSAGSDPLFGRLPGSPRFHVCHAQSVLTLPDGAIPLASSDGDPHQAFRVGDRAWGVQFHPEFDEGIMRSYIDHYRDELIREGQDGARAKRECSPTPWGGRLLKRFARIVEHCG